MRKNGAPNNVLVFKAPSNSGARNGSDFEVLNERLRKLMAEFEARSPVSERLPFRVVNVPRELISKVEKAKVGKENLKGFCRFVLDYRKGGKTKKFVPIPASKKVLRVARLLSGVEVRKPLELFGNGESYSIRVKRKGKATLEGIVKELEKNG